MATKVCQVGVVTLQAVPLQGASHSTERAEVQGLHLHWRVPPPSPAPECDSPSSSSGCRTQGWKWMFGTC